jgi:hypothetical protein
MIAPASGQLAEQFGIHSSVLLAMTTSVFVLGYGGTCCIYRRQPRLIYRHHSFWAFIPRPAQRDIRTIARPTNLQPVVSRYMLSFIPLISVKGPSL